MLLRLCTRCSSTCTAAPRTPSSGITKYLSFDYSQEYFVYYLSYPNISFSILYFITHPLNCRYRSIRVNNKAFQSRVAGVPGGAELLLSAGYAYTPNSCAGSGSGSESQQTEQEERFLVHTMDSAGKARLRYTLYRYYSTVVLLCYTAW